MNIDRIREFYYTPPRANDIAAWAEIHRTMGTPDGSDATMREWALQRIGQKLNKMLCDQIFRNNVASTSTLAHDATQVQPAQTASQEAGSDPMADLEAMRKDLQWLWDFAHHRVRLGTAMAKILPQCGRNGGWYEPVGEVDD